uniref:Putative ovule protein n=1 Tax=Solanum chacoense TaxID=4108 RepID=A0A0V0H657_SOLCH
MALDHLFLISNKPFPLDFDRELICIANTLFIPYSHQKCLLCYPNIMRKDIEMIRLQNTPVWKWMVLTVRQYISFWPISI